MFRSKKRHQKSSLSPSEAIANEVTLFSINSLTRSGTGPGETGKVGRVHRLNGREADGIAQTAFNDALGI
jgi:hypothetical protein